MNTYKRHRFPPDIMSYAVWLYFLFNLSHRDMEDLLAERGIIVTRESIRLWCIKFGTCTPADSSEDTAAMATRFTSMKSSPVCRTIQINGKQHYLWRVVDQESLPREAQWVW